MKTRWLFVFVVLVVLSAAALPVQAQDETMLISAKALDDHECDSSEWHFVITQIDDESLAPGEINVVWANGASESVGLEKFTGGVAHYTTVSNLDSSVVEATAWIYVGWSGQFNLSHGPCKTPTPPPTTTPTDPLETPTGVLPTATSTIVPPTTTGTPPTATVTATGTTPTATATDTTPTATVTGTQPPTTTDTPNTPTATEPALGGEVHEAGIPLWVVLLPLLAIMAFIGKTIL